MEPHGQSPWYLHVLRRNPPKHTLLSTRLRSVILFAFIHGHRPWSSAKPDKRELCAVYEEYRQECKRKWLMNFQNKGGPI